MQERAQGSAGRGAAHPVGAAVAAMLAVYATLPLFLAGPIAAQGSSQGRPSALGAATIVGSPPRLQVPGVVIGAPSTETTLGIELGQGGELPANSYVRIRGLNPQLSLTAGHVIAPGAWAVPVAALPDLRVVIPANAAGRSDVSIALVAIDGGVVAEARTTLVVAAAALGQPSPQAKPPAAATLPADEPPPRTHAPRAAPSPAKDPTVREPAAPRKALEPAIAALPPKPADALPPTAAPRSNAQEPPPLSSAARERSEGFLARGRKLLEGGDFASARLFFRRAADEGLAEGALALGTTFDPAEIDRLHALGIRPDTAEARRWYEKARELGAGPAAERRLERLGSR